MAPEMTPASSASTAVRFGTEERGHTWIWGCVFLSGARLELARGPGNFPACSAPLGILICKIQDAKAEDRVGFRGPTSAGSMGLMCVQKVRTAKTTPSAWLSLLEDSLQNRGYLNVEMIYIRKTRR